MRGTLFTLLAVLMLSTEAQADRGAISLELGGGGSILMLPAPYATGATPLPTSAWMARVGVRYALSDAFELSLSGFFEPRVVAYHPGVTIDTSRPDYPGADAGRGQFLGTLTHTVERFGAAVGARRVWGSVLRLHVGGDVGWSHRTYTQFDHIGTAGGAPSSHGLRLDGFSASGVLLAPTVGLEWAFHDKWSISFMPRVELLVGPDPMVAFSLPLVLSHSWYL